MKTKSLFLSGIFTVLIFLIMGSIAEAAALKISAKEDRSGAVSFTGQTISGDVYIFLDISSTEIKNKKLAKVQFLLDGSLMHSEGQAPYDFAGTGASVAIANPYNVDKLAVGNHVVKAKLLRADGSLITSISGQFNIALVVPYRLLYSKSADRSNPYVMSGQVLSGNVYIYFDPGTSTKAINKVEFYVDDVLKQTEKSIPYDLMGSSNSLANPYNVDAQVSSGTHTIKAKVYHADLTTALVYGTFVKQTVSHSVALSWDATKLNEDGSLAASNLRYRVYVGKTSPVSLSNSSMVNEGTSLSYLLNNASSGTYYYSVTAYDPNTKLESNMATNVMVQVP